MVTVHDPAPRSAAPRSNWGRWGCDDEIGAINLIDTTKRVQAAGLIQRGLTVSLSRDVPTRPYPGNPYPAQHYVNAKGDLSGSGSALDYYGMYYHGWSYTHIDALCHIWEGGQIWNGRSASDAITFNGATFGGIEHWRSGIFTRGVLLDVPRYRSEPYVTQDRPVDAQEMAAIASSCDIDLVAGDAVVVYSGRNAWEQANGALGGQAANLAVTGAAAPPPNRPGLAPSCLDFFGEVDASVIVWDQMDLFPPPEDAPLGVHSGITSLGLALVDNALLEPLAEICAELKRYEFALLIAPLTVVGGTGSPVNPIAIF